MLRKFICQIVFCVLFFSSVSASVQSPFFIPFEPKKDLTEEDILSYIPRPTVKKI